MPLVDESFTTRPKVGTKPRGDRVIYFSNMFCYGDANDTVGITGIRGCMGIVFVGAQSMYAIHIPPDAKEVVKMAGETFVNFVKNNEGGNIKNGRLFGFLNGENRSVPTKSVITGDEELRLIKKGLSSFLSGPKTVLYRINKHLGINSGGTEADGVVIMIERVHVSAYYPDGVSIFYKRADDVQWTAGGEPPTGQYKARRNYLGAFIPTDMFGMWRRANDDNCSITGI